MAGGEAWLLFNVWRAGHGDWLEPWRVYNLLDRDFRSVRDPRMPVERPRWPSRVRAFVYGCAKAHAIVEGRMREREQLTGPPPGRRLELPAGVSDPREER